MNRTDCNYPIRVLLVEDDEHDRVAVRRALHQDHPDNMVTECVRAEEALARLGTPDACGVDLVLVDHKLPGMCGFELCRELLDAGFDRPLVLLTGDGSEQLAVRALKAGVDDYIVKDGNASYLELLPIVLRDAIRQYRERRARHDAELALRRSEAQLSQIIEQISVPAFVIDADHVVTHWNHACECLTGVPAAQVIGSNEQWRAFYAGERPVMADLIIDGAIHEIVSSYYEGKFRPSALIADAYEAEDFFPAFGDHGRWLFFTAAPLRDADGRVAGAIETLQDTTEQHRAEQALRESEGRFRELSITDGLTGLYNARHLFATLEAEVSRAQRYGHELSVLLLDADDFKHYNDTYGHFEGDNVLVGLTETIRGCLRATDSAYRYGGEEFVVILPDTGEDGAAHIAERVRANFAARRFGSDAMTVSIGVAQYLAGERGADVLRRADAHLYCAKRGGKNRVCGRAQRQD
ncbi:MAG: diguanylate cyclase [Rhodocyclales bacterium]|nr:diguanylate cyclase [Rhodocyclales bacterium]